MFIKLTYAKFIKDNHVIIPLKDVASFEEDSGEVVVSFHNDTTIRVVETLDQIEELIFKALTRSK
jgi:hypothetical protein